MEICKFLLSIIVLSIPVLNFTMNRATSKVKDANRDRNLEKNFFIHLHFWIKIFLGFSLKANFVNRIEEVQDPNTNSGARILITKFRPSSVVNQILYDYTSFHNIE